MECPENAMQRCAAKGAQENSGDKGNKGNKGNERKTARSTNDGGHVVGQDHHRAKLTDHEVWLIHELRAAGVRRRDIAIKFDISFHTVHKILCGRRRTQIAVGQK